MEIAEIPEARKIMEKYNLKIETKQKESSEK
jgi:hypothetical protein